MSVTWTAGAMTVRDLITLALMRINIVQPGQPPTSDQLSDSFLLLNLMLDWWATQRLTMPYTAVFPWPLVSTKGTPTNPYTVGPSGDVNLAWRPIYIDHLNYRDNGVTPPYERPLTPLTSDAYSAIPLKTLTSPLPGAYWYQPTYTSNLGALYFWMIPTQANLSGVLYAPSPLAQFPTVDTQVVLPQGYAFALVDNLAVTLASTFRENVPPDPGLVRSAALLKEDLQRTNVTITDLSVDPALVTRRGVYNIFSDTTTGRP
jgi:hypothetical protein